MASPYFFSFWDSRLLFIIIAYEKLAARIATIQREKEDKEYRAKRISLFMRMLAGQEKCLEFDPAVFTAFVEKVVVSGTKKDVRLVYVLRDGSEYRVVGVPEKTDQVCMNSISLQVKCILHSALEVHMPSVEFNKAFIT